MNLVKKILFICSLFIFGGIFAQENKKTIKVSYNAYPTSTRDMPSPTSRFFKDKPGNIALAQSYRFKYSLFINAENNKSLYKFDELIRENIPVGKESWTHMVNNKTDFVYQLNTNEFCKRETTFQREFYSTGDNKEIEWDITNETKTIAGLSCTKAVSKNEEFLLTVWFTEDFPASSGPSYFLNLPGLVLWAEDFFWTIELEKIEYLEKYDLDSEIKKYKDIFEKNKKNKTITESLLLVKKSELTKDLIRRMQE